MIDPFRKIANEDKTKILRALEADSIHLKKGTSISEDIRYKNIIGIVLEGCIQIASIDFEGNRTITEELRQNAVFGSKISSLNDQECELYAKEDSTVIFLEYFALTYNVHNSAPYYQQFISNLLEITIAIINERNERILILSKKTIRNRLLKYFEIMRKKYGMRSFRIPFTYTDLADYLGVDRSAMTREIKNLKDEGIIEVKNRRITLLH